MGSYSYLGRRNLMAPISKEGPKFSLSTITALVEVVTGGAHGSSRAPTAIYRSASQIELILGKANIDLQIGTSSRVKAVREVLRETNAHPYGDVQIAKLIGLVIDPDEYGGDLEKSRAVIEALNKCLKLDGFAIRMVGNRPQLLLLSEHSALVTDLRRKAEALNLSSVTRDFERALTTAENDPEDALTSACSVVESVCKCLLESLGEPMPNKQDIAHLVQTVQGKLNLAANRKDIDDDVRHILGGLTTVAMGIGALRTHGGDAHGRGKAVTRVDTRIAKLAIHAASTLSIFFLETWERQRKVEGS